MKLPLLLTLVLSVSALAADAPLALVGGRVYLTPDGVPILDGTVVVDHGKIVAVGKRDQVKLPDGAQTLDCKGAVVVAGFQNSHVHFTEPHWADSDKQPAAALDGHLEKMLTRHGFTTVVDTGSFIDNTVALRKRIEAGELKGPRIYTAGSGLYPPDGTPFYLKGNIPDEVLKHLPEPKTVAEATPLVNANLAAGADLTKLFTASWIAPGKALPMPIPVAAAAVAATHAQHKLVFSHPSTVAGLDVALAAKVDVLAHSVEDTRGLKPSHLSQMKQQKMGLVPTLTLFKDDDDLYAILDEVRNFARQGGQVLFGTDVGFLPDDDTTTEFTLMGNAGLSWREILASLTTAPAQRFGEEKKRGQIAVGFDGDLVVLEKDPALDVRAFAAVRNTIRGGRVIFTAKSK